MPWYNYILLLIVVFGVMASILLFRKKIIGWYVGILMFVTDVVYNLATLYDGYRLGALDPITIILRIALVICGIYFIYIILSNIKSKKSISK